MRPFAWLWILGAVFFGVFLIVLGASFFSGFFVGTATFPFYRPFFFWPFGWLFGFFFLFFVLRFLFWPWGWGYHRRYWDYDRAYYILRERYARGELSKEQYEAMLRDLEQRA